MTDAPPRRSFIIRALGPITAMYWLMLFAATHLPQMALPTTTLGDKTEHFITYGILGALLATWLGLARRSRHPLLVALRQRTGVQLYGVNYKDTTATARRFLGRYGNPFVAVGVDADGRAAIDWGVTGMPETFIVNGKGEVVYKHIGPISAETLETRIIPAIRAAAGGPV